MEYYLAPWTGTGREDDGGAFCPPTDQFFSLLDWRADQASPDGWCLLAVAQRDNDVQKHGGGHLGDDLTDKQAGKRLMAGLGLNYRGKGDPSILDAVLDLFVEHATPDGDKSRWNPLTPIVARRPQYEVWLAGEQIIAVPVISGGATYTESFNKADSTTLGPDLTWTEVDQDLQVLSNVADIVTTSAICIARAESDNATDNNYAQFTIPSADTTATNLWAACARFVSGAYTFYLARQGDGTTLSNTAIRKVVTSSVTTLTTGTRTKATNDLLRCEANGSTINMVVNGSTHLTVTDTAIATGKRGGFELRAAATGRATADSFQMGDLATPSLIQPRRGALMVPAYARR